MKAITLNKIIAVAQQFHTQANNTCPQTYNTARRWQQCINQFNE